MIPIWIVLMFLLYKVLNLKPRIKHLIGIEKVIVLAITFCLCFFHLQSPHYAPYSLTG